MLFSCSVALFSRCCYAMMCLVVVCCCCVAASILVLRGPRCCFMSARSLCLDLGGVVMCCVVICFALV